MRCSSALVATLVYVSGSYSAIASVVVWTSSTETSPFTTRNVTSSTNLVLDPRAPSGTCPEFTLATTGRTKQTVQGFGACFNELGWDALSALSADDREAVLRELWHPDELNLVYNRVPVGANDYADGWYSHDEMPAGEQDLMMKHFSVERDLERLIPYITAAQTYMDASASDGRSIAPRHLFASAWSPPMWMKQNQNYSGCTGDHDSPDGTNSLIWETDVLDAYAHYLSLFVSAYKTHGINVTAMMVQNEPYAGGCNYPKCEWTGAQMRDFVRDHAGPRFAADHADECSMWLGTLNTDDFLECPNTVLADVDARKYIGGAALQWAGKGMVQRVQQTFGDEIPLIQSENECGDGSNTWDYAMYIFDLMRHYLGNGVVGYTYWNPILNAANNGSSYWGWQQNSMLSVTEDGTLVRNPEYWVFKHFAKFVHPLAVQLDVEGDWSGSALAFRNKGGDLAVVVMNPHDEPREFKFKHDMDAEGGKEGEAEAGSTGFAVTLEPRSFNTFEVARA